MISLRGATPWLAAGWLSACVTAPPADDPAVFLLPTVETRPVKVCEPVAGQTDHQELTCPELGDKGLVCPQGYQLGQRQAGKLGFDCRMGL